MRKLSRDVGELFARRRQCSADGAIPCTRNRKLCAVTRERCADEVIASPHQKKVFADNRKVLICRAEWSIDNGVLFARN